MQVNDGHYFCQQLEIQREQQACQLSKLALFRQKAEQDFNSALATVKEAAVKIKVTED